MMLKAEYVRKMNKSCFILTAENDYRAEKEADEESKDSAGNFNRIDSFYSIECKDSAEMFRHNYIPFFLRMQVQRADRSMQFCYDITGKRSLEQLLEYKSLDYKMLQKILNSFDQSCIQTENYMLSENDIYLKPEFVFLESDEEQMFYCYLPDYQTDLCKQFKAFMEYLLQHLDHKDEQAVQLAYGIHQQVVEAQKSLHTVLKDQEKIKKLFHNMESERSAVRKYETKQYEAKQNEIKKYEIKQNEAKEYEIKQYETKQNETKQHEAKQNNTKQYGTESYEEKQHGEKQHEAGQYETMQHETEQYEEKQYESKQSAGIHEQQDVNAEIKQRKAERSKKEQNKREQMHSVKAEQSAKKQAAEKLKNLLRRKIYTNSSRYTEEETVFEADTEEEAAVSNPTVCLMPKTDGIQNRFVYQGADRSRDFECREGMMILGSDRSESDICIPLPMVSRIHARVEIDAEGTYLEDMNSTNGTEVNGKLLQYRERRMLKKGDIISLAGESYSFH